MNPRETNRQELSWDLDFEAYQKPSLPFKLEILAEDAPEGYFPNFLFYSIEIANSLIDYLYDNISGGFYTSMDEHWQESSINKEKRTYDNAQAILALLKLSDAVINQTEREFAIDVAEKTGNFLITDLYDEINDGFFTSDSSKFKKPGIQAKSIQALLALYEITGNVTYLDKAVKAFNFLDNHAWDNTAGNYVYLLSQNGEVADSNPNVFDPYDPQSKRVDHNVLMGDALLNLYQVESEEKYLTKAQRIYDFVNTTCRNVSTGLFYTGINGSNIIIENDYSDIFINSLVLEFLAHLYNVTEEVKYYNDFFTSLYTVLLHFWDNRYGGFYATYSYIDPEFRDAKKYTERQLYGIRALDEAYKITNNSVFYNLLLDVVEFLNEKLYDNIHTGYFQLTNNDGTPGADSSWNNKNAVTQSLAIYSLANLWMYSKPGVMNAMWLPSMPIAYEDSVTIVVAAFDAEGISNVLFNFSMNDEPYQIVEMVPNSLVGNMFNTTLDAQSEGTSITFNIIVNDSLGNQLVRGSYSFSWQVDEWPPQILEIGISPGIEIPVNSEITIAVSAQDVPLQGDVKFVRIYYHLAGEEEESIALERIDPYIWEVTFEEGFPIPGTYGYYFEAIDNRGNFAYNSINYFYIVGHLEEPFPFEMIIGGLIIFLIFIPAVLYTYVEYKKKSARKILKTRRETRYQKRRGKRNKRGTKRIRSTEM
ncbi:MAG: AGE family epimerase/isomerase [Candidatus Heimdallarchaeota archaeon]|nr:MAG: AGE family epimerase/isomerase [Candidatus Heimdallarchaeota archaeon]